MQPYILNDGSQLMPFAVQLQPEFVDPNDAGLLEQVVKCRKALLKLQKKSFVAASFGVSLGVVPAVATHCDGCCLFR